MSLANRVATPTSTKINFHPKKNESHQLSGNTREK